MANLKNGKKIAYAKKFAEANDDILNKIKTNNVAENTTQLAYENNISQNEEYVKYSLSESGLKELSKEFRQDIDSTISEYNELEQRGNVMYSFNDGNDTTSEENDRIYNREQRQQNVDENRQFITIIDGNNKELENSSYNLQKNSKEIVKSTLIHEIQHYIQTNEKLFNGNNADNTLLYLLNLGEIESKDTEKRLNYSDYKRREIIPESMKEKPMHGDSATREYLEKAILKYYNLANGDETHDKELAKKIGNDLQKEIEKRKNSRKTNNFSGRLNNISFSLDADSQGRKLTQQQVEFFNDSKVRDDNRNLRLYITALEKYLLNYLIRYKYMYKISKANSIEHPLHQKGDNNYMLSSP